MEEAVRFIRERLSDRPATGLILGTGLGMLAGEIQNATSIDYEEIPHFPVSTVETHHGRLVTGTLEGHQVIALQGRFHLYEGYDARDVTLAVRVLRLLGVERLLISNAAGGMNPHFC
ncbi:MAG TPA: purine-nucleoside phosphorylase, partial [Rhodothermia bacterium]|nr:purine-nucleoside phosphorylase [Rhodothermia bacterium]